MSGELDSGVSGLCTLYITARRGGLLAPGLSSSHLPDPPPGRVLLPLLQGPVREHLLPPAGPAQAGGRELGPAQTADCRLQPVPV